MKRTDLYKIWSKVPVNYYQLGIEQNIFQKIWHFNKVRTLKEILLKISFENCLDVGCASGYMTSEISKRFPNAKYFGVDAYDKAIKYGRNKYPHIKFETAIAEKLPFDNSFFDLIVCYETMEHVIDPTKVLSEIKRVLKKGGMAVVAMDSGNLMFRLIWHIWENSKGKVWKGAHLNPFHHEELAKLIRKSGLRIKQKKFSHIGMEVIFVLSK